MKDTLELRAHHIGHLHRAVLHGADVGTLSEYISSYVGRTIDFEVGVYKRIIEDPDIQVKIIDNLDIFCKRGCPNIGPDCMGQLGRDADNSDAELYDLEIGKTYSSTELVEKLRNRKYPTILDVFGIHDSEPTS